MADVSDQDATRARVERSAGSLATAAMQRLEAQSPWYRELSAEERSWVGLVAQSGLQAFIAWYREPTTAPDISADLFGTAPRELVHAVSLGQTLDLIRTVIDEVEAQTPLLAAPGEEQRLRESVLRYSREVAFAAAQVYAQAAEARGAWDARLESFVVDSIVRGEADETLTSRTAALGWQGIGDVVVIVAAAPPVAMTQTRSPLGDGMRRRLRGKGVEMLSAVQGPRVVVVLGNVDPDGDALSLAEMLIGQVGEGPIVVGPVVPHVFAAGRSARAALSGWDAARGWPEAPRPAHADDLLPERVLIGDRQARRRLVERVHRPLRGAGRHLLSTAYAYLDAGGSLEATARALFVHANTVRYRLGRIEELVGFDLTDQRDEWTVRMALTLGRLADSQVQPDWREWLPDRGGDDRLPPERTLEESSKGHGTISSGSPTVPEAADGQS